MNPIITLTNVKTKQTALVYRIVYNSAVTVLNGQPLKDTEHKKDAGDALFKHVVLISNYINDCIRGRITINIERANETTNFE